MHQHTNAPTPHGCVRTCRHDAAALDYATLARMDTVVLLMATRTLAEVTAGLVVAGKPATTPVAVIKWATLPQQRVFAGQLGSVATQLAGERLSPAVVVVGDVAAFTHRYDIPGVVASAAEAGSATAAKESAVAG